MSTVSARSAGKWEFKGFLNIELSEADQQAFDYWGEALLEDLSTALNVLLAADYKISLSWNEWADAFQVAATCKDAASKYYGYCIVVTHEHILQGLIVMQNLYKSDLATEKLMLADELHVEQQEIPF